MDQRTQDPKSLSDSGKTGDFQGSQSEIDFVRPLPDNRADLVLFFGVLSLFLCIPFGLAAWLIGMHDLRRIRAGTMSSRKLGTLKLGTALGVTGTVLFVISLILGIMLMNRLSSGVGSLWQPQPLPPEKLIFAGEWYGKKGTIIRIHENGTADFRSENSSVTGGRVVIGADSISIGFLGISKKWHIDRPPERENENWVMELNGEEFIRKGNELLVYYKGFY